MPPYARPIQGGRGRLDGVWTTSLVRERAADGAAPWQRQFTATVQGSILRAVSGTQGQPSSLVVEGIIQPDGNALLTANGITGDPAYSLGRASAGTPYSFQAQAKFTDQRGTGTRLDERRPCSMTFVRQ